MDYFIVLRKTTQILFKPEDYGQSLITLEKSDINPHIHIVLKSDIQIDTLRKKFKKLYYMKGQVKIKKCKDFTKSIRYILKEFNILFQNLFTNEELEEHIQFVKNFQEEKELDKTNYLRYLSNRYRRELYDDLADNTDYDFIEYKITLFLLEIIKSDYKGFDQILITRWRNAIFNNFHQTIFLHKIHKFLKGNDYAEKHLII